MAAVLNQANILQNRWKSFFLFAKPTAAIHIVALVYLPSNIVRFINFEPCN